MARVRKKHIHTPRPRPVRKPFTHEDNGSVFELFDRGSGGVMPRIVYKNCPHYIETKDRDISHILPPEVAGKAANYICECVGLSANIMPDKLLSCLSKCLKTCPMSKSSLCYRVFTEAVRVLDNLKKEKSRAQRAFNR